MAGAISSAAALLSGENLRLENVRGWPLVARKEKKRDVNYQTVAKLSSQSPTTSMDTVAARSNPPGAAGNIAAIDFGTTYCSIAYKTAATDEISSLKLNEVHARVPTAILLKKASVVTNDQSCPIGVQCTVDSFGKIAQDRYQKIRQKEKSEYLYFERMKMRLQHDQNVNRNMKIYSDNILKDSGHNNEWYLIEVIAFILRYLKDELMKRIKMADYPLKTSDFDWVITIPAIWQARGKQMMREAGYMAGLCGAGDGICYLTYGSCQVQSQPSDIVPAKLSLVPEPEAAALYCQAMKPKHLAKFCDSPSTSIGTEQYIVVDIGGGTVDITAQERNKDTGEIDVVLAPQGNDCGGMKVNREFGRLLQRILGERETREFFNLEMSFPKLLYQDEGILKPNLNHILFKEFEMEKEIFGNGSSGNDRESISVKIPHKIAQKCKFETIQKNVDSLQDAGVELDEDVIYIKRARAAILFKPAIEGILECTRRALTELNKRGPQFRTIYLVGGFGGCKYVYDHMKRFIEEEFPKMNYSLIVPEDHKLAVAHGAVRYKMSPVIHSRCLNRTYGIAVSVNYDAKHHTKEHFKYNEDGDKICHDAFLSFVQRGTSVSTEEVAVDEILPGIDNDKIVRVPFYASEESSLEYLSNRPSPTGPAIPLAAKVGELQFEFPKGDILYRDQRRFRVILDFSSVEITATVRYLNTDTEVKTNLNFLV